jgi:hypothetical protein
LLAGIDASATRPRLTFSRISSAVAVLASGDADRTGWGGQTTLALAVARRVADDVPDGVWPVDLTSLPPGSS